MCCIHTYDKILHRHKVEVHCCDKIFHCHRVEVHFFHALLLALYMWFLLKLQPYLRLWRSIEFPFVHVLILNIVDLRQCCLAYRAHAAILREKSSIFL